MSQICAYFSIAHPKECRCLFQIRSATEVEHFFHDEVRIEFAYENEKELIRIAPRQILTLLILQIVHAKGNEIEE